MRAFHLLILLLVSAANLPAIAADAPQSKAAQSPATNPGARSEAQKVQDCISDIERGQKAGQSMTKPQRMLAEAQCRAAVDTRK